VREMLVGCHPALPIAIGHDKHTGILIISHSIVPRMATDKCPWCGLPRDHSPSRDCTGREGGLGDLIGEYTERKMEGC